MVSSPQKNSLALIADDNAAVRAHLRGVLEIENRTVIEAADSESCLLTCRHLRPDLVLLSDSLTDAFDICAYLKTTYELQHIRILMLLDREDEALLDRLHQAQVDDYVVKPLHIPTLLRRSNALLQQQGLEGAVNFQREILSQMADAVIAVDNNYNVIYWNPEAERAYGIRSEEILGSPLNKAYEVEWSAPQAAEASRAALAQNGHWRGEAIHTKRSGEQIDVETSVRILTNEDNQAFGYISVIHDITERKRMEKALHEQRELADALRDTAAALTRSLEPQSVMQAILDHLGRVITHKTANIMLIEGDRARIGFSRGYSPEEKLALDEMSFSLYEIPTFQQMLTTGESCLVSNTDQHSDWTNVAELNWVKSYLGTPIRAYDHVIGFLNIDSDVPNAFTPVHAERLRAFADQAAIAIENAELYEAIYRDAVEMRALHRATAFLYAPNLFTSDSLLGLCEQVVHIVVNEFGKLDCGILLVGDRTNALLRVARAGEMQITTPRQLYVDGPGLVPEAVRSGKTVYAPDVRQDVRYVASNSNTASELVVPLQTSKGVLGVLDLQSTQLDAFDENEIRLLELFAERVTTALENLKLYTEIRRYTEELELRVHERTGELNRVKERVEAILNHSSDGILLIRTNGAIQQANSAFDRMFGYQPDEAFGKPLMMLTDAVHEGALKDALARVLENRSPERLEIVARRVNGLTFDADVMLSPIISPPQQISSIVCSLRDITPRKRLEVELRSALRKERDLNELKSRFIARASHEFRTPLAVILTASDLLKNYSERMSFEQREEKLNRLQKEVRTIALMLDDMLTISKNEEIKEFNPEAVDLQRLVRETVSEMSEGIGLQHRFTFNCQGDCLPLSLDRKLIQRIITNLLSNAVKYSPIGSTIQVTMDCDTEAITLEVRDEGIGIPETDQEQLFEAFHRAKNVDHISGTGLGLAIVKQAVELHGGEVTVNSQLGKGTIFTVVLPNLTVKENL